MTIKLFRGYSYYQEQAFKKVREQVRKEQAYTGKVRRAFVW